MLVLGAKGHAKEILQVFVHNDQLHDLAFFDDVTTDLPEKLYEAFKIIRHIDEVRIALPPNFQYCLGTGNPLVRYNLNKKFKSVGGQLTSVISKTAKIGSYNVILGTGLNIMPAVHISNDVSIGNGTLLNYGCSIHHDCSIGEFCELSPNALLLGDVKLGNYCSIGAGAIILPKIRIGSNVVVGAGAVVTKDIEDNTLVLGVPARKVKNLSSFF